jgi:predicted lipoprotein
MMARALLFVLVMLGAGLVACVPWTVRPIDEEKAAPANAAQYVDSIWSAKLVPAVESGAVDARTLLDALAASPATAQTRYAHCTPGGACYFLVKGTGHVVAVDTRSRAGLALIDIAPFDEKADVSIQIGPVLRGTALRDASGVVRFTDFVNQLQYADAGNAINDRVAKSVLAPLDMRALKGRTVTFAGAVAAQDKSSPPLAELVPVQFRLEERR